MTGALDTLRPAQMAAAGPAENIWLTASAGTGKTQVLSARVLRLLLDGVPPEAILCITFTKAGAAEMAHRVQARLARWVQVDDGELRVDLLAIGAAHDDPAVLDHARTLFARVIDAPGGGMRIQTIHSFCQTLLASFPLEAAMMPGFRPIEDGEAVALRRTVLADLLDRAARDGDGRTGEAAAMLSLRLGEKEALAFLARCAEAFGDGEPWLPTRAWARGVLNLPAGSPDDWLAERIASGAVCSESLTAVAECGDGWGVKTGTDRAAAIRTWLSGEVPAKVTALHDIWRKFVTKEGTLSADFANAGKKMGDARAEAERCAAALGELVQTARAMRVADDLADGWALGAAFGAAYAARKAELGLADFNDLIARTRALLHTGQLSDWIRYKVDQRIDHILVDEAQDTNAAQWSIIWGLASEYFTGLGAKDDRVRTLFTVGDRKQAIFGFQGTDPAEFEQARQSFSLVAEAVERPFEQLDLADNFRSAAAVLHVVDRWLMQTGAETLGIDQSIPPHLPARGLAGQVELWQPIALIAETAEPEGDQENDDEPVQDSAADESGAIATDRPSRVLADAIARQVRGMIDDPTPGETALPGDILILVRARRDLAALIVARLQAQGVPVAGVDRFNLTLPLAVRDLVSAARFGQQPLDDLNLAELLVSPLIGWTHDDLAQHAPRPAGMRLWTMVARLADPRLGPLHAILRMADFTTPYRFFEGLLSGPIQGRARLLARLGEQARDPIDELLAQALAFEARETPTMAGFLCWLDSGEVSIKRVSDPKAGLVQVMTVHGSKGLQAPIVILADATAGTRGPAKGFDLPVPDHGKLPVFRMSKDERIGTLAQVAEAQQDAERREYWRLLYVALTRAERRLIVTGVRTADNLPDPCWYSAVEQAMVDLGAEAEPMAAPFHQRTIYRTTGRRAPAPKARDRAGRVALPDWAQRPAPQEARPPRPLAPSALGPDDVSEPPPGEAMRSAAERGRLMHALFERLPSVERDRRAAVARRWLAVEGRDYPADRHAGIVDDVLAVMDDPRFGDVFGPDALAEVPIAAVVHGTVVSGIVDRLCLTEKSMTVIDFKTGSRVPRDVGEVAPAYLRQMAAYVASLRVIFPGRDVSAALLYTAGPVLITLGDDDLAPHAPTGGLEVAAPPA